MIKDTITQIEDSVKRIGTVSDETRTQLLKLLSTLQSEIEELAKTQDKQAESIAGFTRISAHEATRHDKNPQLLRNSLDELAASVEGFEASHPTLVGTVNALCVMLSNLGI